MTERLKLAAAWAALAIVVALYVAIAVIGEINGLD